MMQFMLDLIFVVMVGILVLATSIEARVSRLSRFELERRSRAGDEQARNDLHREQLRHDVVALQRLVSAIVLVLVVIVAVWLWGVGPGGLVAMIVALFYHALAKIPLVHQLSQRVYERFERDVLQLIERYPLVTRLTRLPLGDTRPVELHSREELIHMVETSHGVIKPDEKQLVLHGLTFGDRQVKEIMTPRSVVDVVKASELLGPLVLDELHKTGHSRFPVIGADIDHIVGMLYLHDILTIDTSKKHTARVETAMTKKVFYIHEDQTLGHALSAFITTHHHLFVVINSARETVGLLSLEDVVEALIGRTIVDEFDTHDDLRAVAARNPRGNNLADGSEDI